MYILYGTSINVMHIIITHAHYNADITNIVYRLHFKCFDITCN